MPSDAAVALPAQGYYVARPMPRADLPAWRSA